MKNFLLRGQITNQNLKFMKLTLPHKIIISFFAVMTSITIIISCKKLDYSQEQKRDMQMKPIDKFFIVPANTDPKVKAIAQSIYRQNQERNFIASLVERVGYPHWDKAMIASKKGVNSNARVSGDDDSSSIVYIPFSKPDSNTTAAVLAVGLNYFPTDTLYHMLYPNQYKQYSFDTATNWNARTIFHLFTDFDYQLFGQRIINVSDGRILGGEFEDTRMIRRIIDQTGSLNNGQRTEDYTLVKICAYFGPYWPARVAANHRTNDEIWIPVCDYVWVDDPSEPGPLSLPGEGGGGGSYTTQTGGHWDTIPPCPDEGGRIASARTSSQPLSCSYIGWQYIWVPDLGTYFANYENWGYKHFETRDVTPEDYEKILNWNHNNIDTIGLDSCIRKVLNKLLNSTTSLGRLLCKMERSILENNNIEKFNIKLAVKNLGGDTLGLTTKGKMLTGQIWSDTLYIDQGVVDSATEIGVAQVIIHEFVHAYLKSLLNRYNWTMNPSQIAALGADTLFSIFIDSMVMRNTRNDLVQWLNADPQKQHSFMADHVLNSFSEAFKYIDDARNSDEFYWLMGWVGLKSSRTINFYWPNYPLATPNDWPPTNPAPSNDSTWGLKYALTQARLDSMRKYNSREFFNVSKAKGRPKQPGGCY